MRLIAAMDWQDSGRSPSQPSMLRSLFAAFALVFVTLFPAGSAIAAVSCARATMMQVSSTETPDKGCQDEDQSCVAVCAPMCATIMPADMGEVRSIVHAVSADFALRSFMASRSAGPDPPPPRG